MGFDEKIASISIEPITRRVINLNFCGNSLKFRCQRCAVFCCKLSGPKLLPKDVDRLKQAGYDSGKFLNVKEATLKSRRDGSCLFLSFNTKKGLYQCSVYAHRPTFCRLYPFQFEKSGPQSYALNFIPCCNGLNVMDGEVINEKFYVEFLQNAFVDLIDSNAI